jgi:hypothetical protein
MSDEKPSEPETPEIMVWQGASGMWNIAPRKIVWTTWDDLPANKTEEP